jgi:FMN phosphatase YigB (HAD superfamily)
VVLVLLDLDNTLIDRSAAFKAWAIDYVPERGGDPSDVDWLIKADREGYESRPRLAEMIGDHAEYDIVGGAAAGLDTVWLHRGRSWPADLAAPTHIADDFPASMRLAAGPR